MNENSVNQNLAVINFIKSIYNKNQFIPLHEPRFLGNEKVAYNVFNVGDTNENYTKQMLINEIKKIIPNSKIKYVSKNENARDYKVLKCKIDQIDKLEVFIPEKKETVIGSFDFLDGYILRGEKSDAISKLYVRNIKTNEEEEMKISD